MRVLLARCGGGNSFGVVAAMGSMFPPMDGTSIVSPSLAAPSGGNGPNFSSNARVS